MLESPKTRTGVGSAATMDTPTFLTIKVTPRQVQAFITSYFVGTLDTPQELHARDGFALAVRMAASRTPVQTLTQSEHVRDGSFWCSCDKCEDARTEAIRVLNVLR